MNFGSLFKSLSAFKSKVANNPKVTGILEKVESKGMSTLSSKASLIEEKLPSQMQGKLTGAVEKYGPQAFTAAKQKMGLVPGEPAASPQPSTAGSGGGGFLQKLEQKGLGMLGAGQQPAEGEQESGGGGGLLQTLEQKGLAALGGGSGTSGGGAGGIVAGLLGKLAGGGGGGLLKKELGSPSGATPQDSGGVAPSSSTSDQAATGGALIDPPAADVATQSRNRRSALQQRLQEEDQTRQDLNTQIQTLRAQHTAAVQEASLDANTVLTS